MKNLPAFNRLVERAAKRFGLRSEEIYSSMSATLQDAIAQADRPETKLYAERGFARHVKESAGTLAECSCDARCSMANSQCARCRREFHLCDGQ